MVSKNELTIILPFLNEGVEVERTLESLINHTNENLDIILINDCSDDGYDYMAVSKKYGTKYVVNEKRCGVAKCREIGIEKSTTEYFLLLDAHMRVYDERWYAILINLLREEHDTLFCLQSKVLLNICGIIKECESVPAYGAFVEMNPSVENFLDVSWSTQFVKHMSDGAQTIEIPCVLGAGYACNKQYWNSIHGLKGLRNYGLDEQFISLKVWLSGGRCKLVNNVTFGHVYRQIAPYHIDSVDIIYNKLFIAKTLLPNDYIIKYETCLKNNHSHTYQECLKLLCENKDVIQQERGYFERRLTNKLEVFLKINNDAYFLPDTLNMNFDHVLASVLTGITFDIGLFSGKAGVAFIYMLLARKEQKVLYELIADRYIQQIWNSCTMETSISFSKGLMGIGWLCEFLYQNQMAMGNPDDILTDLDDLVNTINPVKLKNLSLDNGIIGISAYVYARNIGCKMRNTSLPFDKQFLNDIIKTTKNDIDNDDILEKKNIGCIYNLHEPKPKLSKKDFVDMIDASLYKDSPICICIKKLLFEDILLQ